MKKKHAFLKLPSISIRQIYLLKVLYFPKSCFLFFVMCCPFWMASGQQKTITGLVKDAAGTSLPGVTVQVKGTAQGTVTNEEGAFRLTVSSDAVLEISFVGYKSQEVAIHNRNNIQIVLRPSNSSLNELVVIGYGKQKKVDLTGAVDQVGSKYFENRPVPSVTRAIEGVIPNLNIDYSDGRPTSNPAWNVRGLTSIGAGGQALILIDGVAGDPANLNPNDIESVTVLKDAASAAIYGSRGAFGVILITTKTADNNSKPQVTYSASYSINEMTTTPHLVTDGYLWAKMFSESYSSWYNYATIPSSIGSSGLSFSSTYLDSLKYRSEHPGQLSNVTINPSNGNYVYYGNTNWFKELYAQEIPSMQHSISVSGGSAVANYRISGRYYQQDGLYKIRSDKYARYNLRIEGGVKVNNWLKLNSNNVFSSYNYTDPFRGSNIWSTLNVFGYATPLAMMYNPDGTLTRTSANSIGTLFGESQSGYKENYMKYNISFVADILKNAWTMNGDFSYQNYFETLDYKFIPTDYSVKPGQTSEIGTSLLGKTINRQDYYTYNLYSNYQHNFGNHFIKVLVGGNMEISKYQKFGVSRDNLLIPNLSDLNLAIGQNTTITGGGNQWATIGFFSRINYNYKEKYLLEINGRYDGSSKFPLQHQFGFFPSVSAGWRLSEEKFMSGTRSWLDNLKLRASYGTLGNSQIAPYLFLEQLTPAKSPVIINGNYPSYVSAPAPLPSDFTWERATTLDFGMDISLLKERLSTSFDWYDRKTTDMITVGPVLPAVYGASAPLGNNADLSTKGFELSVTWNDQIKSKKPITYSVRFTLANNVAHILKFYNPQGIISPDPSSFVTNYYPGQRVGDIWGYTTEGLFTSEDDIKNHADQSAITVSSGNKVLPGDIKFKDLNHDGKIDKGKQTLADHGDWRVIGNSSPQYSFGITGDINWNNFSLSAFFQGIGKRDWYPAYQSTVFWGQYAVWYGSIPQSTLKNNWTLDGNKPNSYWPRYRGPMAYGERELQPQTRYLQNAAYIRLKDLTISYSLPKEIVNKIKLENIGFYLSGQNIWTYSPMFKITKDIDPESVEAGSNTALGYPMLKTYTFGINVTF